jgi:hypothetical protein
MSTRLGRVAAVCAVTALLGLPPATFAGTLASNPRPGEAYFRYESPHTGLEYEYATRAGLPGDDVTAFRISTRSGILAGKLHADELLSRIVLSHLPTGQRAVIDLVQAEPPRGGDIHVSFSDRDEHAHFRFAREGSGGLVLVSGAHPAESDRERAALRLALDEAAWALAADSDREPRPPAHLAQVSAAVFFSRTLMARLDGGPGEDVPAAGRCHLDFDTYQDCVACCDEETELFNVICHVSMGVLCRGPWCRLTRYVVCGGLSELHEDTCVSVMCNGKHGDPGCPPDQMCGDVQGSSCWQFCGITQRAVCGHCPMDLVCCAPM